MKRVGEINEKVAEQQARFDEQRAREAQRIAAAQEKLDELRKESGALEQSAEKASIRRKQEIRKELMQIGAQCEKLEQQIYSLQRTAQQNEVERLGALDKLRKKQNAEIASLNKMSTVAAKARRGINSLGGKLGAFVSIGALAAVVNKLDAIAKRARDIGLTASQLQEMDHQAKLAGMSAGSLDGAVKSFAKNIGLAAIGTGRARVALDEMGISLTDSNGLAKDQNVLLREAAHWFEENAGQARNAGLAARLFGENGVEMLRVFEQGGEAVDKIFDANSIDEAAAAAEHLKEVLENTGNFLLKLTAPIVKGWGHIVDFLSEDMWNGIGSAEYKRAQKKANEDAAKLRKKIEEAEAARQTAIEEAAEARRKADAEAEERIKKLGELDKKLAQSRFEREATNSQKIAALKKQIAAISASIIYYDKGSVEYGEKYARIIEAQIKLEQLKAAEEKKTNAEREKAAKQYEKQLDTSAKNAVKRYEELRAAQKAQSQSRSEFEYETKLAILKAQGRTKEAEALEFAQKRNALMERYGYSLEQATKIQKTLNDLQGGNKTQHSDEAKAKAEEILKRGQTGSVGKRTLAEAQAIVEGTAPEDGFRTSMFKKYADTSTPPKIDNLKVDSGEMAKGLEDESKQIAQDQKEKLEEMNAVMEEIRDLNDKIKTAVDGQTTATGNQSTTLNEILKTLRAIINGS